jgi:glutamate carboxypeptidase
MFTLAIEGRASHAGLDPEKGVSAVLELARQTLRLHELNDLTTGTTVTVNVVQGRNSFERDSCRGACGN